MMKPLATLKMELREAHRALAALEADTERSAKITAARKKVEEASAETARLASIAQAEFIRSFQNAGLLPEGWCAPEDDLYGTSAARRGCEDVLAKWLGLASSEELKEIRYELLSRPDSEEIEHRITSMCRSAVSSNAFSAGKRHLEAEKNLKGLIRSLDWMEREIAFIKSRIVSLECDAASISLIKTSTTERKEKYTRAKLTEIRRRLRQLRDGEIAGPALPGDSQ